MPSDFQVAVARVRVVNAIHKATRDISLENATELDDAWNAYDRAMYDRGWQEAMAQNNPPQAPEGATNE